MTRLDPLTSAAGPTASTDVWREQLLDALLRVVFVLGLIVAVPSVAYSSYVGEWIIAVVDAVALVTTGVLAFRPSIGFQRRAVGFLAINYVLGVFLFLVVGPVAGMYLLGVPVLAAILLGQRPAVLALILNGITMVALGFVPLNALVDDGSTSNLVSWLVITTNFMFVNAIITLSAAAILSRLERSLRLNRRLAVAVEQSPNGIIISEPDGSVVYANAAAEGYFAFDARTQPGLALTDALNDCEPPFPVDLPPEGWDGMTSRISGSSAQRRTFSLTVRHSHDDDDQPQIITIAREVTDELALQEQIARSERLQALGALVGGTAHDFNNALGAIMGLTQLLRSDLSDHDQLEIADDILLASDRAQAVVRQLMMLDRQPRSGLAICNLSETLKRELPIYQANLPANLRLDLDADHDVEAAIDANDLHHTVANLVTNAAHAMRDLPEGTISIVLREVPTSETPFSPEGPEQLGDTVAHLSVTDTGHGIEASMLSKVFDPFFTTKAPDEGTGLGLPTVHATITAIGGRITIDSSVGVGTTANLYLPIARSSTSSSMPDDPSADPSSRPRAGTAPTGPGPSRPRVLLVDDETMIVTSIARLLESRGYSVTPLTEPTRLEELLEGLDGSAFDLVITDISMPSMSGVELARVMRSRHPTVPVILMSGYGDGVAVDERSALGLDLLIDKPFTIDQLVTVIEAAFDRVPPAPN